MTVWQDAGFGPVEEVFHPARFPEIPMQARICSAVH